MEPQKKMLPTRATGALLIIALCIALVLLNSCGVGHPQFDTQTPATEAPGATGPFNTEHPVATPSSTNTIMIGEETEVLTSTGPTFGVASTQPPEPPTLSPEEQFKRVDAELRRALQGKFKYTAPSVMKLDETFTIVLLLNPSLSADELATQIVENSGLVTSTAEPGKLLSSSGGEVRVVGSELEITPLMKAVLVAEDPEAFGIQPLHDNEVQVVGKNTTTNWRWLITARKGGAQKLILIIYRQVKLDDEAYWRDVETYRSDINVNVTFAQWLGSLDWTWIAGILVTALLIPAFWRWYDQRKKQTESLPKSSQKKKTK
jgi:hypothetical protein